MRWTTIPAFILFAATLCSLHGFAQKTKPEHSASAVSQIAVERTQAAPKSVVVTAIGDCTLGSDPAFGYEGTLPAVLAANKGDYSYIFRGVHAITAADDLTIANLEGTFTLSSSRYPKQFAFKGPPDYAKILSSGSIEAVNLANNHSYDYYEQGYLDTIRALEQEKIAWFGEGAPKLYLVNGVKVGLLGYAFEVADRQLINEIAAVKQQSDLVVVSFHWGTERAYWPDEYQRHLAYLAIDSGADLVIGHHPHVLQGLEVYKQRLIAYSLGNFAFGGNMNPVDKRTMLLQTKFTVRKNKVWQLSARVIPARISSVSWVNDYQPTVLQGEEQKEFLSWFVALGNVRLDDTGDVKIDQQ